MNRLIKGLPATHFVEVVNWGKNFRPENYQLDIEDFVDGLKDTIEYGGRTIAIGYCREKTEEEKRAWRIKYGVVDKNSICEHYFIPAGQNWGAYWEKCFKCGKMQQSEPPNS